MFEVGDRVLWRWDERDRKRIAGTVIEVRESGRVGGIRVRWDRIVSFLGSSDECSMFPSEIEYASVVDALAGLVLT